MKMQITRPSRLRTGLEDVKEDSITRMFSILITFGKTDSVRQDWEHHPIDSLLYLAG